MTAKTKAAFASVPRFGLENVKISKR